MATTPASSPDRGAKGTAMPQSEVVRRMTVAGREISTRLPVVFDGALPAYFTQGATHRLGGPSTIVWISNIFVQAGAVYTSGLAADVHWPGAIDLESAPGRQAFVDLQSNFAIDEASFLITSHPAGHNFFHFLIDSLPSFRFERTFLNSHFPIIFSMFRTPFQGPVMDLLLHKRFPLYGLSHGLWLRECALISAASRVDAVDFLRARSAHISPHRNAKRLYISRRSAEHRRIVNEVDLEPVLAQFDFQIIECENIGFDEQIALFKGAEIICGPHGAGLTNIAFCQYGASVLEIILEERLPIGLGAVFWELACAAALDYHILAAERIPFDDSNPHDGDMYVDKDRFAAALDHLVKSRA